jgi:molybdopterin converting factor small subunit
MHRLSLRSEWPKHNLEAGANCRYNEGRLSMRVPVHFYSYFKELAGCPDTAVELPAGSTVGQVLAEVHRRYPSLAPMQKATLIAVGVEYQDREYILREGEEISLFPPVQGG